ncbi:hypothetical protein MHJ85_08330 [Brevibacterium ravenspurgense]|uniref:hypothetical protein n=1 Tax=Brevibacterium ravenspurgense TaxID=479117 RepID=UPI001EF2A79F|nr:hypothetical protein [Brevibacterium ravenspurgense]MCG7301259.1 hypothetical protein [Brevibacterium ravenspurgense]
MNYEPAAAKNRHDNSAFFDAVSAGDSARAGAVWRSKIENAVRHMSSVACLRRFDAETWQTLIG